MSLIRLDNVTKSFGGDLVLTGVDLRIEENDRIGLIGRNGTGKSTIFRLIMGETEPDQGLIERMRRRRCACLRQLPHFDAKDTIYSMVLRAFKELISMEAELEDLGHRLADDEGLMDTYSVLQERFTVLGGYEYRANIARVLTGLGFAENEFELPVSALSGGQRTRLMLAIVLLEDADLLLLDEPENHLDLAARDWLESFLKDWPRAFIIISHDRAMLNAVVNRVVELENGALSGYTGNYDAFIEQKALVREQMQKTFERQQEYLAKEQAWVDRFRYKATKARQAQSRQKRIDKIERVEAPGREAKTAAFNIGQVERTGQVVLRVEKLAMAYDTLSLYRNVSFHVERGERVGIIGPNGCGKTTLLRHIAEKLGTESAATVSGEVSLGHKVRLGYYDQHHDTVNPGNDVLKEVHQIKPQWKPEQVRTFLGRFLFVGEDVFKPITALSGGELSRVTLAKLILSEANLLLLDEPTNHLDIASREALEAALADFHGTLVMVSHDRMLIDRLVEKLIVFEKGAASVYLGNYTFYKWKRSEQGAPIVEPSLQDAMRIRQKEQLQENRDKSKQDQKLQQKMRRQMEELEEDIEGMEETIQEMESRFTQLDPADFEAAKELKQEYDNLKQDLAEMYAEWERLAEETA